MGMKEVLTSKPDILEVVIGLLENLRLNEFTMCSGFHPGPGDLFNAIPSQGLIPPIQIS